MSRPTRDFALEVHFARWEFAASHHLTASDAETTTLGDLLALGGEAARDELLAGLLDLRLGYTETRGAPALRAAIAHTYEAGTIGPEDILTFAGAQEAIYVLARVLLGPGDHAITLTPNYQSAETLPLSICEVTGVPLDAAQEWRVDLDLLRDAFRPNTRLLLVNFPNNPTGAVPSAADFAAIVELCRARGVWLFSDEVYRLLETDPARRLPQAAELYERAISLNVMSKAYGLPGLRIGWLACRDADLLTRCERYKHYLSICNAAPSEFLATAALARRDALLARNRALVAENLALLDAFFAPRANLFEWRRPDGGCVAFPRYLGAEGVERFTEALVAEAGVLLLPASIYRSDLAEVPADRFRIGFGRKTTPASLAALAAWLDRRTL